MSALKPAPLRPGYDVETNMRPESVFEFKLRLVREIRSLPQPHAPELSHIIRLIEEFK